MTTIYDFLPGAVGAMFNTYLGHPFDTIRVRMQNINNRYVSSINCLKSTYRNEGFFGIYRGSTASLCSIMAESSVVFATNKFLKQNIYGIEDNASLTVRQEMFIGSLSGFTATIAGCPFETIKCNLQINSNRSSEIRQDISGKYRSVGLYRGFGASCVRNIAFYLLFFPFYSKYHDIISNRSRSTCDQNLFNCAIAGGLSGATTWGIVYPFDVIKCNQQIHGNKISFIQMTKKIHGTKGINGLYRGVVPTLIRAFPANAGLLLGVKWTETLLNGSKNINKY
jgi:hypothetical protein